MATTTSVISKVALILGASRGIGEATARTFAAAGIKVVLAARSETELKKIVKDIVDAGGEASYVVCDILKEVDIANAVELTEKTYGGVDILFANAGWEGTPVAKFHETETADIRRLFDVNVMGPVFLVKYGVPALLKRKGGVFLFNSSLSSVLPKEVAKLPVGLHLYAVTKAAVDTLNRMMSLYEADQIRSYCILPAVFDTQLARDVAESETLGKIGVKSLDQFANFNPVNKGKAGNPKSVGELALNLVSGNTQYKNCDCIVIDGEITWDAHEYYKVLSLGEMPGSIPNQRNLKGEIAQQ